MSATIEELLQNKGENDIFPFFWQHGEDEGTLRKYMQVIDEANCHAVCVESRPHPDFCGPGWWRDMDIILDEAKKRDMKVWILDDSHFPTGFANGAAEQAPDELRRQSVYCHVFDLSKKGKNAARSGKRSFSCNLPKVMKKIPTTFMSKIVTNGTTKNKKVFTDDRLLSVTALVEGEERPVALSCSMDKDTLKAELPKGTRKVYVTFLTRNAGIHPSYINMMDEESCRIQIDAVYEPHWEHYREEFGKTIAGFFSDEPELGNGVYFNDEIGMGTDHDFPWSRELEAQMPQTLGSDWKTLLPLLWDNDTDPKLRAQVRYRYMDLVTRLVEKCFSRQLGTWCEAHGVEYIGHMIEDNNAHARTGVSLGHYFRGLAGQHMAGIDDIGGQVLPQQEDAPAEGIFKMIGGRDGEFYHYLLGKLGVSAAAIDPKKQGRCMCEIFGNYGWSEGPRMEKYLADHFMVQGVNRYVPHAFSGKAYPDRDCPPHFYAHGNNPQYRHFGQVIAYMNRICALISDGKPVLDTAVLYHGDSEWAGNVMLDQKPARILMEHQVDFHVIPADVFGRRGEYRTEIRDGLQVNGNVYRTLVVPYMEFIPECFASAVSELLDGGCKVIFLDGLPEGVVSVAGENAAPLPERIRDCRVCGLSNLLEEVSREIRMTPESWRIRAFHYRGAEEIYYFVNEDDRPYEGTADIPAVEDCYAYDAWENRVFTQARETRDGRTKLALSLRPGESRIVVLGSRDDLEMPICPGAASVTEDAASAAAGRKIALTDGWKRSVCRSIHYPSFLAAKPVTIPEDYGRVDKNFSGFIAYETTFMRPEEQQVILEIADAGEDVEVFVNGQSLGIQVLPPFWYDISGALKDGRNTLRIEVATTLERERKTNKKKWQPTGLTGAVSLIGY